MSYHKRQHGSSVDWIGYSITLADGFVTAAIEAELMDNFTALVQDTMKENLITIEALRSLAGKANRVSTSMYALRPFMDQLWAALARARPDNAPEGKTWVESIASPP